MWQTLVEGKMLWNVMAFIIYQESPEVCLSRKLRFAAETPAWAALSLVLVLTDGAEEFPTVAGLCARVLFALEDVKSTLSVTMFVSIVREFF